MKTGSDAIQEMARRAALTPEQREREEFSRLGRLIRAGLATWSEHRRYRELKRERVLRYGECGR